VTTNVHKRRRVGVSERVENLRRLKTEDIDEVDSAAETVSSREVDDDRSGERPSSINLAP